MLFGKLLPREGNFFELFNQHAGFIAEGARAFIRLIQNYADPALREKHANEVGTAERQADKITAEVNRLLHKTFITPIDREQIHGLINAMDDILDLLQDASETMSLYDVQAMNDDVLRLGDLSASAASACSTRSRCCPGSASPTAAEAALKTCEEIDRLESDADRVMRAAMSQAVPRGDGRARADQAEGDLRAARVDHRPLRGRREHHRRRRPRELLSAALRPMTATRSRSASSRCWSRWRSRSTS